MMCLIDKLIECNLRIDDIIGMWIRGEEEIVLGIIS